MHHTLLCEVLSPLLPLEITCSLFKMHPKHSPPLGSLHRPCQAMNCAIFPDSKSIYLETSLLFFPVTQLVKNLPAKQGTCVRSLGEEDPLEKGKATHSSILAWGIPWTV